jgi:hypothetical protein
VSSLRKQLETIPAGELDDPRPPIPPVLRDRLEKILEKPRVRRPRLEKAEIVRILDGVHGALLDLTVLRSFPDPASHWARYARGARKLADLQDWLNAARIETPGVLALALTRLQYPADHPERLLADWTAIISTAAMSLPRRRGTAGRPRGSEAARVPGVPLNVSRQFARDVAAGLRQHDLKPSMYPDGWFADFLRAIWPHALGTQLPQGAKGAGIRRLLRDALAR